MVRGRTNTRLHGASTCCLAIPRAHVRMRAHLRMHARPAQDQIDRLNAAAARAHVPDGADGLRHVEIRAFTRARVEVEHRRQLLTAAHGQLLWPLTAQHPQATAHPLGIARGHMSDPRDLGV